MAYKFVIDASSGGTNSGNSANGIIEKDFTLEISNYINNKLNELGLDSALLRNSDVTLSEKERAELINNKYGNGNNIIVVSNRLKGDSDGGIEIMYALRNNSNLSKKLANSFENNDFTVNKYYQLRDSNNTALDSDPLIRDTKNNQTIAIYYGSVNNLNDVDNLKNNYIDLADSVVSALASYAGVSYIPNDKDYYVVKKGDSLYSIASKYNTTVDKIKKLNNLSSNLLNIGQILKIPGKDNTSVVDNSNIYTVQKGDSLYSIANKFNTTVDKIKTTNNLSSNLLSIGQKLIIPQKNTENELIYTVQKGDNLYAIANKYNTTVDKIKSANNLSSNLLSIGQKLNIPSSQDYIIYVVKKGDSLYSIASKYNTTVDKIKKLNNLTSNLLNIGQKLNILP